MIIWRKYDEYIEVSNYGDVRRIDTKRKYKLLDNGKGYKCVNIKRVKNGKVIYNLREYVHRLVVFTFIGDIDENHEVNHIDFNKSNNHICNLEIVTRAENMRHNLIHNRVNTSKANDATRRPICVYDKLNNKTHYFKDTKEASLFFGYNRSRFSHLLTFRNGESNRFKVTDWRISNDQ